MRAAISLLDYGVPVSLTPNPRLEGGGIFIPPPEGEGPTVREALEIATI